jgi:hypothetical protein
MDRVRSDRREEESGQYQAERDSLMHNPSKHFF